MPIDTTKCKCWVYPFKPKECFDYCAGKILRYAKPADLEFYLNIHQPLADKIFELTSNEDFIALSDFKSSLTIEEFRFIELQLRNISLKALTWIREKAREEETITTHV